MAETYLTANILKRVKRIVVGTTSGTTFTIEVDQRQYLITAKHVVATLKDKGEITVCESSKNCTALPVKVLRCADPIDIAVLVPEQQQTVAFELEPASKGMVFGQDTYFLGFPYADSSLVTNIAGDETVAFIRKATLSAQQQVDGATVLYLDGRNNLGFSGGPIVFRDLNRPGNIIKVAGVVSGFRNEFADVYKTEQIERSQIKPEDRAAGRILELADGRVIKLTPMDDLTVPNNSDIVIGYAIDHAVDLIRASKVEGPLVKP